MTTPKLIGPYELLNVVQESDPKTFRARHGYSGREVLFHLLALPHPLPVQSPTGTFAMLWKYLSAALPKGQCQVLDMGECETGIYVITELLPGFQSFGEWLRLKTGSFEDKPGDSPTLAISAPATAEATETIIMMEAHSAPADQTGKTSVLPTAKMSGGQTGIDPAPKESTGSLEVRQISPALTEALTQARDAWLAQKLPASVPANPESSGEFTAIFQAPERSAPAPAPAPGKADSGEFTRLFQTPPVRKEPEPVMGFESAVAQSPSPPPPGEFTRIFQASAPHQNSPFIPLASEPAAAPGEFTMVFGSAIQSVLAGEGNGQSQQQENPLPTGPSLAPQPAPAGVQFVQGLQPGAPPHLHPPARSQRHSSLKWVIPVGLLLVALGVLAYFFLMR